ncbi:MAG TPA: ABC transporter permease [Gemmatimonadaceae bacterium]|nr:ABC transporter permease [Gemmatimonadaceae bacterium]
MDAFLQDLRFAARTLRKSPVFTGIAVLCLTLGIATNTTLFSIFNAILLRPFPFAHPEDLVILRERNPRTGDEAGISYLNYLDWRAQARAFTAMGVTTSRSLTITEGEEPERLTGQAVSWTLFPMLGVQPQLGRVFREDEDQRGAPDVVLLSDAVWRRRYNSDSSVIGRTISVNNLPHTVIGVMPEKFAFPTVSELWVPAAPLLAGDRREWRNLGVFARLAPGVSRLQADREVAEISERVSREYALDPDNSWVGSAIELRREFIPEDVQLITVTMMGAVTFVLLIACANVANLMLTRATGRSREIAIRTAIGAGRGRIIRQLLTESVLVALMAGVVAVPLTWVGLNLVDLGIPPEDPIPYYIDWEMDTPTLLYTAGISILTGLVFGLMPALQASGGQLHAALKEGGRGTGTGARKNRLRSALVVFEVALALVLLVGASLFVRSFLALQHADVGFDTSRIMTMRFFLPGTRYDSALARQQRVEDILRRVEALPAVQAATSSNLIPIDGGGAGDRVVAEGKDVPAGEAPWLFYTGVAGHWFESLGVPLVAGRTFSDAELQGTEPLAVINRATAKLLWGDGEALGRRFRLAADASQQWFTVIGVVPDFRVDDLDDRGAIPPSAYLPYRFLDVRNHGLMIRVRSGDPAAVTNAVRAEIRASDAGIPVFGAATLDKVRELSFWQYGLFGSMFGVFGGVALFLAAIGVYGVISYGVSQRTQEIGVRVALGAQRRDVIALVVRQGMVLAGSGIALGLLGAFGVTRVVTSLLFVSATDPVSFGGVAFFLAAVAVLASYFPARRATAVDPISALRFE